MKRRISSANVVASTELAESGSKNASPSSGGVIEIKQLLDSYGNYLDKVQGLAPRTCDNTCILPASC